MLTAVRETVMAIHQGYWWAKKKEGNYAMRGGSSANEVARAAANWLAEKTAESAERVLRLGGQVNLTFSSRLTMHSTCAKPILFTRRYHMPGSTSFTDDTGGSGTFVPDKTYGVSDNSAKGYAVAGNALDGNGLQGGSIGGFGAVGTREVAPVGWTECSLS